VLPELFGKVTKHLFDNVVARFKTNLLRSTRKQRITSIKQFSNEKCENVKALALSPVRIGDIERKHLSQREISKTSVVNILKQYKLKCYRRIKCNFLTP